MHEQFFSRRSIPLARSLSGLGVLSLVGGVYATVAGAQAAPTQTGAAARATRPAGASAPADVVTTIPFYQKENETDLEQTKVPIVAEVDGVRGVFILDTGDYDVELNRTFLQPNPKGGVDSVTDANRIPEHGEEAAHVKLRVGTFEFGLGDPALGADHVGQVVLDHSFGNFSWVFAPRLGNLGIPALESFETIIDYPHKRVVLIKLDSAGHRLAQVPEYTPKGSVPLVRYRVYWGLVARRGTATDTLIVDTGAPGDDAERQGADHLRQAVDSGRTSFSVDQRYEIVPGVLAGVGYEFLHQLGVVGFNARTRQFILYKQH